MFSKFQNGPQGIFSLTAIIFFVITGCGSKNSNISSGKKATPVAASVPAGPDNINNTSDSGNDSGKPASAEALQSISGGALDRIEDAIWCFGDSGPRTALPTAQGIINGTSLKKVKLFDNELKKKISGKHEATFFELKVDETIYSSAMGVKFKLEGKEFGMFEHYKDDSDKKNCVKILDETYFVKDLGNLCSEPPRLDITTVYHAGIIKKLFILSEPTSKKVVAIRYLEREQDYSTDHQAFSALGLNDGKVRRDICIRDFSEK
jgi:hypothetical protein